MNLNPTATKRVTYECHDGGRCTPIRLDDGIGCKYKLSRFPMISSSFALFRIFLDFFASSHEHFRVRELSTITTLPREAAEGRNAFTAFISSRPFEQITSSTSLALPRTNLQNGVPSTPSESLKHRASRCRQPYPRLHCLAMEALLGGRCNLPPPRSKHFRYHYART